MQIIFLIFPLHNFNSIGYCGRKVSQIHQHLSQPLKLPQETFQRETEQLLNYKGMSLMWLSRRVQQPVDSGFESMATVNQTLFCDIFIDKLIFSSSFPFTMKLLSLCISGAVQRGGILFPTFSDSFFWLPDCMIPFISCETRSTFFHPKRPSDTFFFLNSAHLHSKPS